MNMDNTIAMLAERSKRAIQRNDIDYIGDDGLLYCGECHTPKQCVIEYGGRKSTVMCLCDCMSYTQQMEREKLKRDERMSAIWRAHSEYPELRRMTFGNWSAERNGELKGRMLKYAKAAIEDKAALGAGLCLWGGVGTGKSYAAAALFNALVDAGISCRWRSFARLMNFDTDISEELQRIKHTGVVFLDDFGAQRDTEFANERAFQIADAVNGNGLLIVTTNLTAKELEAPQNRAMERIYSRINGKCVKVNVSGQDLRAEESKRNVAKVRAIFEG